MPTTGWIRRLASLLLGGPDGQLEVGAVHGVAGLERDDLAPAPLGEAGPHLGGGHPQGAEVVVERQLDALEPAAHVERLGLVEQEVDAGVLGVRGPEDLLGLGLAVGLPDVLDVEDGQHDALGIAQGELAPGSSVGGELLVDVEHDRHRPQRAVGEAHVLADALVVGLGEEPGQRGEPAVQDAARGRRVGGRSGPATGSRGRPWLARRSEPRRP